MIELRGVSKSYDGGETFAIRGFDLRIAKGEFVVLLGESGCGKTTTLKLINRLHEPSSGEVLLDGQDVSAQPLVELRRAIGYVLQGIGLFPHITVGENIATVPRLLGWDSIRVRERVDELLELVHLPAATYRDRLPEELSGGQQQRVGVARAIAGRPGVVLMDEPFGALDPVTRHSLQAEYSSIHGALGLTTVMVTHDMTEALLLADRIAVMKEGVIRGLGTPAELLETPGDEYVAELMGMPRRHVAEIEKLLTGGVR